MKIMYLIVNVSILEIVLEKIRATGMTDYQVIEQILSNESTANPRMNTPVWPGYSSAVFIQSTEDEKIRLLFDEIKKYNSECFNEEERIRAFLWETTMYIID
jgi:hypothetical protein